MEYSHQLFFLQFQCCMFQMGTQLVRSKQLDCFLDSKNLLGNRLEQSSLLLDHYRCRHKAFLLDSQYTLRHLNLAGRFQLGKVMVPLQSDYSSFQLDREHRFGQ